MKNLLKWSSVSEVKKATLAFLFCSIFQKSISVISMPIFTRLMSTCEYGQFSVYQTWLSMFSIITTFRLDYDVFNKGMTKYADKKNEYVSTMQSLTTCITLICFIIYLYYYKPLNQLTDLPTLIIVAMFVELLFMPALSFWTLKERYEFKYRDLLIVTITLSVFNITIGVVATLYSAQNKGIARILSCILVQTVFSLFFYIQNFKKSKKLFVKELAAFAILFNLPLIPHYFASYILSFADRIMIQKMVGIPEAGIYSVVYNAGLVLTMFSSALNNALIPWQYKCLEKNQFENINKRLKTLLFFLAASLILFMLFAPEIIKIMAPPEYYEGIYVIPPVAGSVFFIFLYNLVCNAEFFYDKNKFTMVMSGICAVANIILNYTFISLFGYLAAGYTTLFCYVLTVHLHILYVNYVSKKKTGKHLYRHNKIMKISVLLIVISLMIALLYRYIQVRYTLIAATFIAVFVQRKKIYINLKNNLK